jgi:hypothetical protein
MTLYAKYIIEGYRPLALFIFFFVIYALVSIYLNLPLGEATEIDCKVEKAGVILHKSGHHLLCKDSNGNLIFPNYNLQDREGILKEKVVSMSCRKTLSGKAVCEIP